MNTSLKTVAPFPSPSDPSASPALVSACRDYIREHRKEFRLLRLANHQKLKDIAEMVAVSHVTIAGWEQGQFLPEGERAIRYLEVLCPESLIALTIETQRDSLPGVQQEAGS